MTTPFHIIIPARYDSSRLPGKPLMPIGDKPMIAWVVAQCQRSEAATVTVATDDARIVDAVTTAGGHAVLTAPDHASGSDRIAEATHHLGLAPTALVVNVQGDEPLLPFSLINQVATAHSTTTAVITTAHAPLRHRTEADDPAVVKVVTDRAGYAMYFSRAAIPYAQAALPNDPNHPNQPPREIRRHIGIYAYTAQYLQEFTARPPSPLEQYEQLEQLRSLWHGEKIQCLATDDTTSFGIDTPADLARARQLLTA